MDDDTNSNSIPTPPQGDDDLKLQNYQDDVDTGEHWKDRATEDMTDDPTELLQVKPSELADELKHTDFENGHEEDDDWRESTEDDDKDGDESNKS